MRILCKLMGCETGLSPCCRRCGSDLYEYDFIQQGWLQPWFRAVWWVASKQEWIRHRCDVCRKPMYFTDASCCSEECYEDWYPF
jgi:hypothetical protein